MMVATSPVKGIFRASLGGVLVLAAGCNTTTVTGSGQVVSRSVSVSSFSHLRVDGAFDVAVSSGARERVALRADKNLLDRLDVGVTDGELHVGLKSGTTVSDATLHADVIVPRLSSIDVGGASTVHLTDGLAGKSLDLVVSGASRLDGTIRADVAKVDLVGSSHVTLAGSAGNLTVGAVGASILQAEQLESHDLTAHVSGASTVTVSVSDTVSAQVSGASTLRYRGTPRFVRRDVSGASTITSL